MKDVLRTNEKTLISPVGLKEANSLELANFVSARPPAGDFYSKLVNYSKKMSDSPTYQENILINRLRKEKLGFKFQQIFPPYIVDFIFPSKLILEIDGNFHDENTNNQSYDCKRDIYIMSFGFTILRVNNKTIINNMDSVIKDIRNFHSTQKNHPFKKLSLLIKLYKKKQVTERFANSLFKKVPLLTSQREEIRRKIVL